MFIMQYIYYSFNIYYATYLTSNHYYAQYTLYIVGSLTSIADSHLILYNSYTVYNLSTYTLSTYTIVYITLCQLAAFFYHSMIGLRPVSIVYTSIDTIHTYIYIYMCIYIYMQETSDVNHYCLSFHILR